MSCPRQVGGSLVGGASGKKEFILPGTAQNPIRRDPLAGGFLMSNLTRRDPRQWEDPLWAVRPVRKSPLCLEQRKIP